MTTLFSYWILDVDEIRLFEINEKNLYNDSNELYLNNDYSIKYDISFIIGSRNDNFGSNPILRLRFTLQNLLLFNWKSLYNVYIEIIVIEWNPISSNKHLWQYKEIKQLLKMNKNKYKNKIYFYSIPPFYNDKIDCLSISHCPYYEYHAKNVGLRRSNGEWKLIMNIDDLFGINLLNLIGYSLKNNLFDKNGIYQGRRNHIKLLNIYNYINISDIIDVEQILEIKKEKNIDLNEECYYLNEELLPCSQGFAAGDFTMIHNESLYKYYVGGYIEKCLNKHLDCEFVLRNIYLNKLSVYYIDYKCGYYHIDHIKQRLNRSKYININDNKQKEINCNQIGDNSLKDFRNYYSKKNMLLLDQSHWKHTYNITHTNWGINGVNFEKIQTLL